MYSWIMRTQHTPSSSSVAWPGMTGPAQAQPGLPSLDLAKPSEAWPRLGGSHWEPPAINDPFNAQVDGSLDNMDQLG